MALRRQNPFIGEIVEELDQHLARHLGDTDKARSYLSKDDNKWIDEEVLHCITDARYFISNYFFIKTEDLGYQGLWPYFDSQEILHEEYRKLEKTQGKVRAMVLKARQMGSTTFNVAETFHKTVFSEHVNAIIVGQDDEQAAYIMGMYESAYDFLPWWMKPETAIRQTGKKMNFDTKDPNLRASRPGLKTWIYADNANKPSGVGRGKCQTPWTQVWTTDGPYTLEDLFRSTCDPAAGHADDSGEWFVPNKPVATWAFNGEQLEEKRVTKIYRQPYSGIIERIDVANGVCIEKTPEHKVLSSRKWKRTVSAGDHLDCIHCLPWSGTEAVSPEFAELLAWQIAEGFENAHSGVQITQKDRVMRDRIADMALAVTGRAPLNRHPEDLSRKTGAGYVAIKGRDYREKLEACGHVWGLRSATKRVPKQVFHWDKPSIAIFLRAYFEAEGCVTDKVEVVSASKQIIQSLRMLCAAFGISLRVRATMKYASNTERKVRRTYYRGNISGPSLKLFAEHVGFLSERKNLKLSAVAENSNGYTLQQHPRITQMFRDACKAARIGNKKILGDNHFARKGNLSLAAARRALIRMESIVAKLPECRPGFVHYYYKNCDQKVLGEWAKRIRCELTSELCEERVDAVSSYLYDGYIYDLEVEDTHNYPTCGVVTHNTFNRGMLSELAFWQNGTQLSKSLFPTMKSKDGFYVMESTANGRNTFWHNLWKRAEAGKIDWHPIFIPYFRRDKTYSLPLRKGEPFILTEDESNMRAKVFAEKNYFVKDEVLNWARSRREEFEAIDGDDKMFAQEYASNPEEAFQSSAITAFPVGIINKLAKRTLNPGWIGEITYEFDKNRPHVTLQKIPADFHLVPPEDSNRLHVWEKPLPGETYVYGADVALGIQGKDFSCVQVIKMGAGIQKDEQVACWHGYINPEDFAIICLAIGWWYNEALSCVEVNSIGMVTNMELMRHYEYENVYRFKRMDRIKNFWTDITGFYTDYKSKRALMSKMSKTLIEDVIIIRDKHLVDELYDFTEDGAEDGAHDDYVMSFMIALYCGHEGEVRDMQEGKASRVQTEVEANVFEILDRFGTVIHSTTSQGEAVAKSKREIGSSIVRTSKATGPILIKGKTRRTPQDYQNSDYAPWADGDGTARAMYEDGWDPSEMTTEAMAEYEAEMENAEESPNAWLYN